MNTAALIERYSCVFMHLRATDGWTRMQGLGLLVISDTVDGSVHHYATQLWVCPRFQGLDQALLQHCCLLIDVNPCGGGKGGVKALGHGFCITSCSEHC